jgi:hypothetical protein
MSLVVLGMTAMNDRPIRRTKYASDTAVEPEDGLVATGERRPLRGLLRSRKASLDRDEAEDVGARMEDAVLVAGNVGDRGHRTPPLARRRMPQHSMVMAGSVGRENAVL